MHLRAVTVAVASCLLLPAVALAGPAPRTAPSAPIIPMGRSVGSPTEGHLVGGAHLADAPYLRIVPSYAAGDVRWGLGSLVGMLDRAARSVRRQYPDAVMSVGHLSKQSGGELDRHASHESGRDADVQFYVKNDRGQPVYADHFAAFKGDGTAASWPGAHFDDARNWALVAALLNDPVAHVSHIFVATPIRARLLAYAARMGVAESLRDRAALTMVQPHGSLPHDDHFHVRISCPSGMTGCVEFPTISRVARTRRHGAAHGAATRAHPTPAAHLETHATRADAAGADASAQKKTDDEPATPPTMTDTAPPAATVIEIDDADGT